MREIPSEYISDWEQIPRRPGKVRLSPIVVFIILGLATLYLVFVIVYG